MSSARNVSAKMTAVTKDLPIKMSSITKLERDGSNFQHWELDIMSYISFIANVVMYLNGERMPDDDKYSQEWADVGNAIIYWSFDRDLKPFFSAARQVILDQIVATRYDPTLSSKTTELVAALHY
ncbi:hypothetical protein CROQUDRAFT_96161 [Cronartium quercuum f. sp. fusiforme G11]|uniref:Uncharacterized protein n=1 Tax=Cronartium quercuum f. sp. fusiforme G11 TaxID=708437 RepID=A0A9P6NCG0_9BASI|nr:hypothetical protein CROQUDRAFT_96161 [Cronartium quercuum f. sp. fusiforme G11]